MEKKFEDILKSINNDILTEEVKSDIVKVFNEAVESSVSKLVEERSTILIENELKKMDDDHTAKMKTLVEAIDEDHSKKFQEAIQLIDQDHCTKFEKIVEKYEKELKEGAITVRNELGKKISTFLDAYLTESIPVQDLKEAVQNVQARKILDDIRKIASVDPEYINESVKEGIKDGHQTIEKLRKDLNQKIKENVEISNKFQTFEASMLLEKKTRDLPDYKKKAVYRLLEGKSTKDIEKNFKFIVEMVEKNDQEKQEALLEETKSDAKGLKIDVPKSIITESKQTNSVEDKQMDAYLKNLSGMGR